MSLEEGWYLMSPSDLEIELRHLRGDRRPSDRSNAIRLTTEEALTYRNRGNVPDELGRSLRLVLRIDAGVGSLEVRRLQFEPDFHESPAWRREGSVPVNIVPLGAPPSGAPRPWWEDDEVGALEREWQATGSASGLRIPGELRSFVFKTIVSLRRAGRPVTPTSVADSVARWLTPREASRVRAALLDANEDRR